MMTKLSLTWPQALVCALLMGSTVAAHSPAQGLGLMARTEALAASDADAGTGSPADTPAADPAGMFSFFCYNDLTQAYSQQP